MSTTAKSVIFDISDNWGYASYVGIRSIEFYLGDTRLSISGNFTAYATTYLSTSYTPLMTFNTAEDKIGSWTSEQWLSDVLSITDQRLIIVFDTPQEFDGILINNSHDSGEKTTTGAKNVTIYESQDEITSTVYGESIANSTVLDTVEFSEHSEINRLDPETVFYNGTSSAGLSQLVTEVIASDKPPAGLSQLAVEIIENKEATFRVAQAPVEVISSGTKIFRLAQSAIEVIHETPVVLDGEVKVSQVVTEVINSGEPEVAVQQLVTEVINSGNPEVKIPQVVVEVIAKTAYPVDGEVLVQQFVTEVLDSGEPEVAVQQFVTEVLDSGEPEVAVQQFVTEVLIVTPPSWVVGEFDTDFSDYPVGDELSDWSEQFDSGLLTYTAEDNSASDYPVGTQQLELVSSGSALEYLILDATTISGNTDLLCSFNMTPSSTGVMFVSRLTGETGAESCYFVRATSSAFEIGKRIDGVETIFDSVGFDQTSDEYWIRFNTSDDTLKARIWNKNAFEPTTWMLDETNTIPDEIIFGAMGIGISDSDSIDVDYFGVSADEVYVYPPAVLYPPTGHVPVSLSTAHFAIDDTASVAGSWAHVFKIGNTPKYLDEVRVYCSNHSDNIRVGVYLGGTETNPGNATLLSDLGITSLTGVDEYITMDSSPGLILANSLIWLVFKGDNPDGFYIPRTSSVGNEGNVLPGAGAYTITSQIESDPSVAFPRNMITGSPIAGSNYYKIEIILSDAPEFPRRPTLVFIVES